MDRLKIEDAIACLLDNAGRMDEIEMVDVFHCLGNVLAQDIVALYDNPPFDRSPLDGYAVRGNDVRDASADRPVRLKVAGKVYAGQIYTGFVETGQAVRIMTGAMIPAGADAVIRQEDTDYGTEYVNIMRGVTPFSNYCHAGEDYKKGEIVIKKGTYIDAGIASVIASMGVVSVKVYRRPQIGVIATGDELIEPGAKLQPGKIYDSNLMYITSRLKELALSVSCSIHMGDDVDALAEMMEKQAQNASLIITTGGVSVGERDVIHEVVTKLGGKQLFWKVKMKPGMPTLAFVFHKTLVICLSGNPLGSVTGFEILVRPVLAKMYRNEKLNGKKFQATVLNDFAKSSDICRFVRGYYVDQTVRVVNGNHSAGAISSMVQTNCLIEVEAEREGLKTGEKVNIYLL